MPTSNIRNPRVYELAKVLSDPTGRSMTSVVEAALERQPAELVDDRRGIADALDRAFEAAIERSRTIGLSAAGLLETALVLGPASDATLDRFIEMAGVFIEPVTAAQARLARFAYRRFGRGTGRSARLDFGDCFSCALARDEPEPLLFTVDDFSRTDVLVAS